MNHLSDKELVALTQKQLPYVTSAFETLLNRYQNKIYGVCKRVLGDDHHAEDATQNTMLKVFHYIKDFKQESSFFTWVYKIAYNESLQIINQNKKYQVLATRDIFEISYDNTLVVLEVESILKKLPQEEHDILMLKYLLELKDKEIAQILNLSLSAVKMRLKRLKEKCEHIN